MNLTISDEYRQKFKIDELEKDKSEIENLRDEVSRLRDIGELTYSLVYLMEVSPIPWSGIWERCVLVLESMNEWKQEGVLLSNTKNDLSKLC